MSESSDASSEITPFPAQVQFSTKTECSPLTENQYRRVIINNYLDEKTGCFYLELDHDQTIHLSSLFVPAQATVPNDPHLPFLKARKDVSDQVKSENVKDADQLNVSSHSHDVASTSSTSRSNLDKDASDYNYLIIAENGLKDFPADMICAIVAKLG